MTEAIGRRAEIATTAVQGAASERGAPWMTLAGLMLLAASVRTYWGLQPRVVWGDEPFYLWLGQNLLAGEGFQTFGYPGAYFMPLFSILAALLGRLAGLFTSDAALALQIGSVALYVICGALLTLPIYGITRRLAGPQAALAAGLTTALSPALVAAVPLWGTMTEPLFLLLIAIAWYALLVAQQTGRWRSYALAGVALGLAYLTRGEALAYLLAGLGMTLLVIRKTGWRRTVAGVSLVAACFGLVLSPYLVAQRVTTGQWQPSALAGFAYTSMQGLVAKDVAAFDAATWGLDPVSQEVYLFAPAPKETPGLLATVIANPAGFLRLLRVNVFSFISLCFDAKFLPWPLVALALLGIVGRPWDGRRLRGELLLLALLVGPLSYLAFFVTARYLAGFLIPAQVWIGGGLALVGDWLTETWAQASGRAETPIRGLRLLRVLPAVLLALILLWQMPRVWAGLQKTHSFQPGHLMAAQFLRDRHATPGDVVMTRFPAIAFHANTSWAATPNATWPAVAAYAQRRVARYLVIDAWEAELRPQLRFLLEPSAAPPALRHLMTLDVGAGRVVIYEFR